MKSNRRDGRRPKNRFQYSLRTLVVLMLVLGPLSGLYGPWIATQIRDRLVEGTPKATPNSAPKAYLQQRRLKQLQQEEQQYLAELQEEMREAQRRLKEKQELAEMNKQLRESGMINPNGTFNMRYHLPPSEQ